MSLGTDYLADVTLNFRKHKELAERALRQVDDAAFFHQPGGHGNSLAVIVKHLAGNLTSRWADFLTTDGDKPGRDRDAEFVIGPDDTRPRLLAAWDAGWADLFQTLAGLTGDDLPRRVTIRGEEHTVLEAINRALTHAAYHAGQITYVARLLTPDGWDWLTIPPGRSRQHQGTYLK